MYSLNNSITFHSCHCERGNLNVCHCEDRSDVAISNEKYNHFYEIASLRRNDIGTGMPRFVRNDTTFFYE